MQTQYLNKKRPLQNFTLETKYVSHVKKAYNACIDTIDFNDGSKAARVSSLNTILCRSHFINICISNKVNINFFQHVNRFVSKNTNGIIKDITTPESFTDKKAILINAVYFMVRESKVLGSLSQS